MKATLQYELKDTWGSLLSEEEMNTNKTILLQSIIQMYHPKFKTEVRRPMAPILKEDLMIDGFMLNYVRSQKDDSINDIYNCFLEFRKSYDQKSRVDMGSHINYVYNGELYVVPKLVLKSFLYHSIWVTGRTDMVQNDINMEIERVVPDYPRRGEMNNGQMKIMTDAILAVDGVSKKDKIKVCIIGSSHEPGIVPKSAYAPLFHMVTHSEFHLFDPYEEESEIIINTNVIKRYRQMYDYSNMRCYDLIIDDAWTKLGTTLDTFYTRYTYNDFLKKYPRHYSLKAFTTHAEGRYYYQVGSTTSNEMRMVSRPMIPSVNKSITKKLGSCAFCRELIYNLSDDYGSQFYEHVRRVHPAGYTCIKEDVNYNDYWLSMQATPTWKIASRPSDICCLVSDYRARADLDDEDALVGIIELRSEHLIGKHVYVSADEYVTNQLLLFSKVYRRFDTRWYIATPTCFYKFSDFKGQVIRQRRFVAYDGAMPPDHLVPYYKKSFDVMTYDEWKKNPEILLDSTPTALIIPDENSYTNEMCFFFRTVYTSSGRCGTAVPYLQGTKQDYVGSILKSKYGPDKTSHSVEMIHNATRNQNLDRRYIRNVSDHYIDQREYLQRQRDDRAQYYKNLRIAGQDYAIKMAQVQDDHEEVIEEREQHLISLRYFDDHDPDDSN